MDNISDPNYIREVGIMADKMMKRYANHPAIIAVGYDNEIGNGFMSYSEADRQRFIAWLAKKYGTVGELNKAWATQRWSRCLNSFDDVDLPLADGPGPSERYLDLHRYWSDVTVARLKELDAIRQQDMPNTPSISNLWDTASRRGSDYLSTYKDYVSFGAEGFYPGDPVSGAFGALMTKGALPTPIWFNEFTAGGGGFYGTPGRSRSAPPIPSIQMQTEIRVLLCAQISPLGSDACNPVQARPRPLSRKASERIRNTYG
jgi:beta-galactosidase